MPKVSIIVPVYNVEKYLKKCLDSLLNQTLENIEIIAVNDGSKDNSYKILEEYALNFKEKIKVINKENGGQGSARNVGLSYCSGEFIGYVDSDDYIASDMYEKMYNMAINNNCDIVCVGHYVVNENGEVIKTELPNMAKTIFSIDEDSSILFGNMGVCNKLYKASFLKGLNLEFRVKKWYEDFDFVVKTLLSSNKIGIIKEPLYYYLLRSGSTMNNSNVERNLEILEATDEIIAFCKENNIYDKFYSEIEYLAILHTYLPTNVRIIRADADKVLKKKAINTINKYMKDNFKLHKHNKYIKSNLNTKKRIILAFMNIKWYCIIKLIFSLRNY